LPETITYSFDIAWGYDRRTSFSDASTCREVAIHKLRSWMCASHVHLNEMFETELRPIATLTVSHFNEAYLHEIIRALSVKGDVELSITRSNGSFSFHKTFVLTFSGRYALPASYWAVLASRSSILRTNKPTFMEAIQSTNKYDSACWFHARDQGSSWRAWDRALKGIGPTSRQMIYFSAGPVHWYYTQGRNRVT